MDVSGFLERLQDSPEYSELVRRTLVGEGFSVAHAPSLADAMVQLEDGEFDALLLDLGLPDGSEIFTLVRACGFTEDLPIIVLTGSSDHSLEMAAHEVGAQEFLIKNCVDRRKVPGLVRRAIERHRCKSQLAPVPTTRAGVFSLSSWPIPTSSKRVSW